MSLLLQALREVIIGRRGLIKASPVWLATALLLSISAKSGYPGEVSTGIKIFLAAGLWAAAVILFNDLADRHEDAAVGKSRWIQTLPPKTAYFIPAGMIIAAGILIVHCNNAVQALGIFLAALIPAIFYSSAPLRFKERNTLGPAAYGVSCALAYAVFPWVIITGPPYILIMLSLAVILEKATHLIFHQIVDHDSDRKSGMNTYVVNTGLKKARKSLAGLSTAASIVMFAIIGIASALFEDWRFVILMSTAVVFGLCRMVIFLCKKDSRFQTELTKELSPCYLCISLVVFRLLPIILIFRLFLRTPSAAILGVFAFVSLSIESAYGFRHRN